MAACGNPLKPSTTHSRAEAGPRTATNQHSVPRQSRSCRQGRRRQVVAAAVAVAAAPACGARSAAAGWVGFAAAAAVALASPHHARAQVVEAVFNNSCAGCHSGGGNIIRCAGNDRLVCSTPAVRATPAVCLLCSCPSTTAPACLPAWLSACRRDATLQLDDLKKYGLADSASLYQVIYSGKGSMPG